MPKWPKPAEGSWTQHYPELGTGLVGYEDSISPEFHELEREAIFKRAWLNVGRVEQLPRSGSYFTKEIQVARTSIVVVRDGAGRICAFHNICRHRGNKLVWRDFPREETSGVWGQSMPAVAAAARAAGFEAPHYRIDGPHRMLTGAGAQAWRMPREMSKRMEWLTRSSLFGAWDAPELPRALPAGVNPAQCDPWGISSFQIWPNLVILIWSTHWCHVYRYWPLTYNTMRFESDLLLVPSRTARERLAHEMAAVTYKEFALQDANTLEATQSMLESRVVDRYPLDDQEITCRHFHKTAGEWVAQFRRERLGA